MCKSDQDCPRGQICVRGVCAATARRPPLRWLWSLLGLLLSACVTGASDKPADEQILITSGVGYSSKIGTAEGKRPRTQTLQLTHSQNRMTAEQRVLPRRPAKCWQLQRRARAASMARRALS